MMFFFSNDEETFYLRQRWMTSSFSYYKETFQMRITGRLKFSTRIDGYAKDGGPGKA